MPCMQRSPIPQNPVLKHGLFVGSAYTQCRDMQSELNGQWLCVVHPTEPNASEIKFKMTNFGMKNIFQIQSYLLIESSSHFYKIDHSFQRNHSLHICNANLYDTDFHSKQLVEQQRNVEFINSKILINTNHLKATITTAFFIFFEQICKTYSNPHLCKADSRVPAYSGNCWYTVFLKVSANISTMSFRLFVKESKSLTGWKHKPPMHRSPSGQLPQRPQRSPDGSA
ncbi:conserved hypothetical protein [Trichinella spiralis]|uniref:Uncharacterized protein n=1 Tax=Trichinella spiralis TaxID=6334 RepID=E5SGI5_TRISP|nr:conserved hypothetical protein [Trichinella spiralis]KRY41636.1 hypothetical protein T01_4109 [Trichinella spiralis]